MENNPAQVQQATLSFISDPPIGGASMTLTILPINAPIQPLPIKASATGTIHEGTRFPEQFTVTNAPGYISSMVIGETYGKVNGRAVVDFTPPAIGQYDTSFSATFEIDNSGNGTGTFSVGHQSYKCKVEWVNS
ncbi:MAG: hypothetical protein WAQ98_12735 [Blastocatellia bacterium]